MADILCGYTADRDETLVAYLYGDIDPAQHAAFDAHIVTCERCRHELAELQGVRATLETWHAPELRRPLAVGGTSPAPVSHAGARRAWREIPVWAQAAAALLVCGISAGIANLDVRYDGNGLTIRTGWSRPNAAPIARVENTPRAQTVATSATTPWRPELDALEKRLRSEFHGAPAAGPSALLTRDERTASDAQLLRKVRALLDESERKQRNELALNLATVIEEFNAKRGNDLVNIRSLRNAQTETGIQVVQQQQRLEYLTRAASIQQR